MSKKYIDAEEEKAVLELVKMHREEDVVREEMFEMATKAVTFYIDNLPTVDAVEVVRCRDCKYFNVYEGTPYCNWCGRSPNFNDFCSHGEKASGENNG